MDTIQVMLVDDEVEFLDTLIKRMRKRNVDIAGVKSGEEALIALDQNQVDVVILDVRMPGMDGIEVLREIKRRYPLIEVIMLTGHANIEVAVQGMELGAFDYLMKPMDIDELLYKVEDAHKNKKIQGEKLNLLRRNKE
ncbi:MAG: response regulator [Deltaproteobacteria bacterium]|nr:response regulator [Deltaproteobacteria bacterium]MBW1861086.1 response regulator [Deltaproteobacteria bacterium]